MPPRRLSDRLADLPYASSLSRHQGDLVPDEDYEGVHFDGLDLDAPRAGGSRFMECAFTQVTIARTVGCGEPGSTMCGSAGYG